MELEYVEASGSWYDIGLVEGQTQRVAVKYTVYRYATYHRGSPGFGALDRVAERVGAFLSERFPEEWAELRGIADGARVDLPLLVASNYPQAVSALAGTTPEAGRAEQCSNLMFPSSEWGPLIGGTLDDDPLRFILRAHPEGGVPFCCIMWPGWVACTWGGMNAAGLALCGASAHPMLPKNQRPDRRVPGLDMLWPQRVLLRSCRTVDEALDRLAQPDMGAGNNYSLMDASGRGVQVQAYAGEGYSLRAAEMGPDEGLCCGNFLTWEIEPDKVGQFPELEAPFQRYSGVKRAVDANRGRYTVEAMKRALAGHEGDPAKCHSLCNDATVVAMIAAPTVGRLLFASRPVCVNGFREYPV